MVQSAINPYFIVIIIIIIKHELEFLNKKKIK